MSAAGDAGDAGGAGSGGSWRSGSAGVSGGGGRGGWRGRRARGGPGGSGRRSEPPKGNVGGPGRGDPLGLCPPCPRRRGADQCAVRAASGAAFVRNSESPQDREVVGAAGGSPARLPPPPKLRGPPASLWFAAPPPLTFAPLRTPRSPSAPRARRSPLRPPTPLPGSSSCSLPSSALFLLPRLPPSLPPPPPASALSPSPARWSAVPTPSPRAGEASPEEPQFPRPRRPGSQCPRIRPQRPLLGCPGGPALLRGFSCAQSEPGGRGSREGPRGSRRSRGSERVSAPGTSFVSNPRDRVRGCAKRVTRCVALGLTPCVPPGPPRATVSTAGIPVPPRRGSRYRGAARVRCRPPAF